MHRHADTNKRRHRHAYTTAYTHMETHTPSPSESRLLAAGAKLNAALPVHLCVPSFLSPLLPSTHLFDSQGQGDPPYNGTPFITTGTITGDISLSENFKPIPPSPHPPLYLPAPALSLCLSFLSSCHPLLFLLSSTLPLCMAPCELYCRLYSH